MNWFNNDKGFFQGGKSFGGRGLLGDGGVLSGLKDKLKSKPCAGMPGVCPYSCKPLQTPTEQQTGISDEARAQGAAPEAGTGIDANPEGGQAYVNKVLPGLQANMAQRRMI